MEESGWADGGVEEEGKGVRGWEEKEMASEDGRRRNRAGRRHIGGQ
jgi:hypothetical protein